MWFSHFHNVLRASLLAAMVLPSSLVWADAEPRADSHAPLGVMADHLHKRGEFMVSYRYMRMRMDGNRMGTRDVSPEFIVQNVPNRFAGQPGQPQTLRVVPTDMDMEMHMFGGMYGVSDDLTLMVMVPVIANSMDHVTFQGGMGTTRLGGFETEASGLGDVSVTGLFRIRQWQGGEVLGRLGLSAPTGSNTERDDILTPMGMDPRVRLPYPMQVGAGTWDLLPGLTARQNFGSFGIGAQYVGRFRLGRNDQGYSFGDVHEISLWGSYLVAPWMSGAVRLQGVTTGRIDGQDAQIGGPVQTANPDFQGGDRLSAGLSVNLYGTQGALAGHRIAAEYLLPFAQDINGPQLEVDGVLVVGYQFAW